MRQSRTAGRIPSSARRLALTSLGAGLAVAAAAPMASAATVAAAAPAASSDVADSAALGSNATSANAVPVTSAELPQQAQEAPLTAPEAAPAAAWSRLGKIKLYPLAGTGVDPLSNVVETSLGGIPVSTQPVADTFADGLPVADLPVLGSLLGGPLG